MATQLCWIQHSVVTCSDLLLGCNSSAPSQPVQSAPGPTHREVVPRARYKKGNVEVYIWLTVDNNNKGLGAYKSDISSAVIAVTYAQQTTQYMQALASTVST